MLTGAGNQTKRGSTCSEAQILWKQIPQHLPWGQSTGALNAGALLLRRRRWAAAPVSGTRVKKQEGNSRQRNGEGPKDTWSGRPGTARTNTPAGGPVPLSFSFLKQKNGTNATSLTLKDMKRARHLSQPRPHSWDVSTLPFSFRACPPAYGLCYGLGSKSG